VSESPRLPWRTIAASTALALLAAAGMVVLLSDDASDEPDDGSVPSSVITLENIDDVPTFDEASYTTWDGDEVALSTVRGKPTVVNFFASTCIPCISEMPAFEEVYQDLGSSGAPVQFLGVAISTDRTEDALALVDTTGVTYPTGKDLDNSVAGALDVPLLPTTVFLDADGNVAATSSGELSADELRSLIAEDLGVST
jgi:thiol-disulfide isomerase/thioredoxin